MGVHGTDISLSILSKSQRYLLYTSSQPTNSVLH